MTTATINPITPLVHRDIARPRITTGIRYAQRFRKNAGAHIDIKAVDSFGFAIIPTALSIFTLIGFKVLFMQTSAATFSNAIKHIAFSIGLIFLHLITITVYKTHPIKTLFRAIYD
jgi:hypothetical protein